MHNQHSLGVVDGIDHCLLHECLSFGVSVEFPGAWGREGSGFNCLARQLLVKIGCESLY